MRRGSESDAAIAERVRQESCTMNHRKHKHAAVLRLVDQSIISNNVFSYGFLAPFWNNSPAKGK
jgi:hypothetical protein